MNALTQAITDLKHRIASEGFDDAMIAEVAEDNGVHPAMLARKFQEATQRTPAEYKAPVMVEPNYEAIYNKVRRATIDCGAFRTNGRETWAALTAAEKESFKALVLRSWKSGVTTVIWTR